MDLALVIIAGVLLILGFIGTFLPALPGAPLAWAGLLVGFFSDYCDLPIFVLVLTGIVAVVVSILDNIFPVALTKKYGGSRLSTILSTIGLIVGIFIGPLGILLGPFIGAFVGELIDNKGKFKEAFITAWGALVGFLLGVGTKMIAVSIFIFIFAWAIIRHF